MFDNGQKWIKDYEGRYSVTEEGKIYSHLFGKVKEIKGALLNDKTRKGLEYRVFTACSEDGVSVNLYFHRCAAEAFIPNPDNKPEVNHKDGNKQNNHYLNLEWSTSQENRIHAYSLGMGSQSVFVDEELRLLVVDDFINNGMKGEKSSAYSCNTLMSILKESDLERNNLPKEIINFRLKLKLGGYKQLWEYYRNLVVLCEDKTLTSFEISKIMKISHSTVSRIRNGVRCSAEYSVTKELLTKNNLNIID